MRRKRSWGKENKYSYWYDALIEKARNRDLEKPYERHHVRPMSLGGAVKSETVKLTYREHFLAHWLLTKFARDRYRAAHAFAWMSHGHGAKRFMTSWQYDVARRNFTWAHKRFLKKFWENLSPEEREQRRQKTAQQVTIQRLNPAFREAQRLASSRVMLRNWKNPEFVKTITEEARRRLKVLWTNPEFRNTRSKRQVQIAKDNWADPDIRAKTIKSMKETQGSVEYRKANAERTRKQWQDPKFREFMGPVLQKAHVASSESNRQRVWTPEMTAKRVAKFIAFYDAKRGGPKVRPGKPRGERNGMSKLTEKQVLAIRSLEGEMGRKAVAAKFGVSYWTVGDIQKRRIWKHVE